jgi:hypothetical protein
VPITQLEQAEMAAEGIEGFAWFDHYAGLQARRMVSRLGPAFEMRIRIHAAQ